MYIKYISYILFKIKT